MIIGKKSGINYIVKMIDDAGLEDEIKKIDYDAA